MVVAAAGTKSDATAVPASAALGPPVGRSVEPEPEPETARSEPETDLAAARTAAEQQALAPEYDGADAVAQEHFAQGRFDEAAEAWRACQALRPGDALAVYNGACCAARLGAEAEAIALLRQSLAAGVSLQDIADDPDFDGLHRVQGFRALLGLPPLRDEKPWRSGLRKAAAVGKMAAENKAVIDPEEVRGAAQNTPSAATLLRGKYLWKRFGSRTCLVSTPNPWSWQVAARQAEVAAVQAVAEAKRAKAKAHIEGQQREAARARAAARQEERAAETAKTAQLSKVLGEAERALRGHCKDARKTKARKRRQARPASTDPGTINSSYSAAAAAAAVAPTSSMSSVPSPAKAEGRRRHSEGAPRPGGGTTRGVGGGVAASYGEFSKMPGGAHARRSHPFLAPEGKLHDPSSPKVGRPWAVGGPVALAGSGTRPWAVPESYTEVGSESSSDSEDAEKEIFAWAPATPSDEAGQPAAAVGLGAPQGELDGELEEAPEVEFEAHREGKAGMEQVMAAADEALRHALQADGLVVGGNDTQERLASFVTEGLNASQHFAVRFFPQSASHLRLILSQPTSVLPRTFHIWRGGVPDERTAQSQKLGGWDYSAEANGPTTAAAVRTAVDKAAVTTGVVELAECRVDTSAARLLTASVVRHRGSISALLLQNNDIGDEGVAAIAGVLPLCEGLRRLDLSWNDIGPPGALTLAGALDQCGLHTLTLRGNRIGDRGCTALAHALGGGQSRLTQLDLWDQTVADRGVAALARALPASRLKVPPPPPHPRPRLNTQTISTTITTAHQESLSSWRCALTRQDPNQALGQLIAGRPV
jgi:hypothetical protein